MSARLERAAGLAVLGAFAALCAVALWRLAAGDAAGDAAGGATGGAADARQAVPSQAPSLRRGAEPSATTVEPVPRLASVERTAPPGTAPGSGLAAGGVAALTPTSVAEARWVEEAPPPSLERPLGAVRAELRRCLDDAAERSDDALTLRFAFRPLPDGRFGDVSVLANSAQDPYLAACATDVLEELRFEPSGREDFRPAQHTITRVAPSAAPRGAATP